VGNFNVLNENIGGEYMKNYLISLLIGLVAAIIDIAP
jgi:hypothetical protein